MVYMWRREGASFLVSQRETASLVSGVNNNKDILNSCVFYIKQIKKKKPSKMHSPSTATKAPPSIDSTAEEDPTAFPRTTASSQYCYHSRAAVGAAVATTNTATTPNVVNPWIVVLFIVVGLLSLGCVFLLIYWATHRSTITQAEASARLSLEYFKVTPIVAAAAAAAKNGSDFYLRNNNNRYYYYYPTSSYSSYTHAVARSMPITSNSTADATAYLNGPALTNRASGHAYHRGQQQQQLQQQQEQPQPSSTSRKDW